MVCNKFIKVRCYNYLGNVRQLWRTSGKSVDSNFSAIWGKIQGNRLLITYKVPSYCPCSERQPTSCQPNGFSTDFLCNTGTGDWSFCFVTAPFHGRLCALCLSLLSFLSQSHRAGALTSNLLWKIFTLVGEGISLMLSHRLEAVVPIPRCHLCSTR